MPNDEDLSLKLRRLLHAPDDSTASAHLGTLLQLATIAATIRDAPATRRDAFDAAIGGLVAALGKLPWLGGPDRAWTGEPGLVELRAVLAEARTVSDPSVPREERVAALDRLRSAVEAADRVEWIEGVVEPEKGSS